MRRSKLEMQIDILKALACNGKLKLTRILYEANVNCNILKECLDLLIEHDLVERQTLQKDRQKPRIVYAITGKGFTALKSALEIGNAIPIVEVRVSPSF